MLNILEIPFIKNIWKKYGYNIFLFMGAIGVFLIFISETPPDNKQNNKAETVSLQEYKEQLEQQLETLLTAVNGAGKVKIMITLESGEENIYAWQEKSTNDEKTASEQTSQSYTYENEVVFSEKGSEKQPLVEKIIQPEVQGVVVVCQGADNIEVVSNITNAVSVALDISTNRICVIKMQ